MGNTINWGERNEEYKKEAGYSEWRVSLFAIPRAGDDNSGPNNYESLPEPTFPPANTVWKNDNYYQPEYPENQLYGFYADGFFDRRPIEKGILESGNGGEFKAVCPDKANAAFPGSLFFNQANNASLFFPGGGRREFGTAKLAWVGTGYYWSSSPAFQTTMTPKGNVWSIELAYPNSVLKTAVHTYGYSIRCVKD